MIISPILAYVDPSVMTYTIQAVAGVIIALGAVIGVTWRIMRKKAQKVLKIDENSNKEMEEEVQIIEEDTKKADSESNPNR